MSSIRTLLTILLTCVYFVVCPLLVLYALGYIYNPLQPGFVRTGIIDLVTVPSGAEVFLEGSRFTRTTPALIEELLPGQYTVTVRKSGYRPWRHTVTVKAGKASAFRNILLVPGNWQEETLTTAGCQDIIPVNSRFMFILKSGSELSECLAYGKNGVAQPLVAPGSSFASWPATRFTCVKDSEAFVVNCDSLMRKRQVYLNLESGEPNAIDITELLAEKPLAVSWSSGDAARLFAVHKNQVSRIDPAKGSVAPSYTGSVRGFGISGNWLYVIDQNDTVVRVSFEKQHREELSPETQLTSRFFSRSAYYDIRPARRQIMFFLGLQGDLVGNISPYQVAADGIRDIAYNGRSDMFVCWSKTSVGIVDFSRDFDKTMFHEKFRYLPVFEGGRDIRQVFWAYKDSHILFNDNGDIFLLELEPQEPHHCERIVTVKRDSSVYYDADDRALYYLDQKSGVLKRLQLIGQ